MATPSGTGNGKTHGGAYTRKRHRSEKVIVDSEVVHESLTFAPETTVYGYKDIVIEAGLEDLKVIGEFVAVL